MSLPRITKKKIVLLFTLAGLIAATLLSLAAGHVEPTARIVLLRLQRTGFAIVAGAGLAVCGAVFQTLLRNPLAEPYILGISSGAGLGSVLFSVFYASSFFFPVPAMLGSLVTIGLVYTLSRRGGRLPVEGLLLSGVVINVIFSSLILFFISTAHQSTVRDAIWWLLGSLEIFDPWLLLIAALFVLAGCAVCFSFYRELDALSLGEEEALHLGIDTERVSTILFITASLMTAVLVSICGLIGFVGLIVPHIARSFVGSGHRYLVPATALIGAILLIAGDVLGRTLLWPIEIPIGVVTSILGGPFFLYLLARGKGGRWR